jgi:DNA-directed RNA polymerase specialized sigma24 family protein
MPPAQIADLLETRIETVRVWLHRARRMFVERQRQLEAEEGLMP